MFYKCYLILLQLCFGKGDIITVTQTMDGGWWEGTLNGRTGWFPSNYVKEVRAGKSTTLWGEEGGGTLNGRTGWFPSNYVKEVRAGKGTTLWGGGRGGGHTERTDRLVSQQLCQGGQSR